MRVPWQRPNELPEGVRAADAIIEGIEKVDRAVNQLRELVEQIRKNGGPK
jgi:hypothetical protein